MSGIASKNLYELLGNDPEQDSDREPDPPVKAVEKTLPRTAKRNAPAEAPVSKAPVDGRGARRGGLGGNDGAFRDRNAGSANNRGKPTDDAVRQDRHPRHIGGERGGRGGRGGGGKFDRHSRGVGGDSEKQAAHGWGAIEGGAELGDEQAGEAIAQADKKEALTGDGSAPADIVGAEAAADAEPEDNSISYADYMVQQAEKKAALGTGVPEARKPSSELDKKWANAKPIAKEEEEDFVAGSGPKAKRDRERKQKDVVEINYGFVEAPDRGRGGFRGGRGRGEFRGRGEGGRGRGRGGDRPPPRQSGPRNGGNTSIDTNDQAAFPSLGG